MNPFLRLSIPSLICLEAERQISGTKGWDPEKLGRTIVDGSTQIGRTGFSRRGS